jgi:hypothetical protein
MTMLSICDRRDALALVEYHHGAVPAVLDKLGAASAAVRTIPRYGLIIRHINVTPGHYFLAALAFDFHFSYFNSIPFGFLSMRPQLRRIFPSHCLII